MRRLENDAITLRGMRFHVLIGVLPHEREHPQPVEVDLTAWVRAGEGAGADGVVDYRRLYADVRDAMNAPELRFLEDLGDAIAGRALGQPGVERVRVSVRKPHAALGGPLDYAEVAVDRARDA